MLIFLDFDGVLHPVFPRPDFSDEDNKHFAFMPRFCSVLEDFPLAQVVISSSWRETKSLAQLRSLFPAQFRDRIIGKTPVISSEGSHTREREVLEFFRSRGADPVAWVALDDMDVHFSPGAPLILCEDGFFEREEAALRACLFEHTVKAAARPSAA